MHLGRSMDSDKTEYTSHRVNTVRSIGDLLKENLLMNIEEHLKKIDVIQLYNSVLQADDSLTSWELESTLFNYFHWHLIKLRHYGMFAEANNLRALCEYIRQKYNKYMVLDTIVKCESYHYDLQRPPSLDSAVRRMYT